MDDIHGFVIEELQRRKGRWTHVARGSGVSKRTIEKIARREWENPGVKAVQQLANYFKAYPDTAQTH